MNCNMSEAKFEWFSDGTLNASGNDITTHLDFFESFSSKNVFFQIANCIDRHSKQNPSKTALIWEQDEPGKQTVAFFENLL